MATEQMRRFDRPNYDSQLSAIVRSDFNFLGPISEVVGRLSQTLWGRQMAKT